MIKISCLVALLLLSYSQGAWAFGKKPAKPDPKEEVIHARWETNNRDGALWSQYVFDELPVLGANLIGKVPSDITSFCPNYKNLNAFDQKNFWVYLLSSMSQLESGQDTNQSYRENFLDAKGNYVVSRGLLQISIESGNGYGCGFKTEQDLHDPYQNLACGLRILNRWIGGDGLISGKSGTAWRGGARYWAVLRSTGSLASIRSWTKAQEICVVR